MVCSDHTRGPVVAYWPVPKLRSSMKHSGYAKLKPHLPFDQAFPAGSGPGDRTTYMFTYLDAHPDRPSLESLLEDYWQLMPKYQVPYPKTYWEAQKFDRRSRNSG